MASADDYAELIALLNARDMSRPVRKKHRLPTERYAASENEFFFTLCARQHGAPFTADPLAQATLQSLRWLRTQYQWRLLCYCLMPDHLHFIAQLPDHVFHLLNAGARGQVPEGILDHLARFKRYTTTQLWWKMGGHDQLWQRSSFDRVIRYNDSVDEAVAYVVQNPVRKGLVATWEEYPYAAIIDEW